MERSLVRRKQTQWLQNKSLSRALHGPVQTAVNAAAYKLDNAMRDGRVSVDMIEGVRSELISSLDILSHADGAVITVDQGINRIVAVWDGICNVNVSISQEVHVELKATVITRSCFIDIVSESVSNAVRHGRATRIEVSAELVDSDIHLNVRDNGSAPFLHNSPGLGSALLDDCSTSWVLQLADSGRSLQAVIPVH
jgi:signal transduction histidine kinase